MTNPFRKTSVPLSSEEMLDISFRRAFEKQRPLKRKGNLISVYRIREISRIQTISDTLVSRLDRVIRSFPSVEKLDPFYRDLLDVLADLDRVKHSLGALKWASKIVSRISKSYILEIKRADDPTRMAILRREAMGRISSVLKQVGPEMDYLREIIPKLKDLPDVDPSLPTVVIAGIPNTGKSTLLSKITAKEPEIAPYPFTTKGIIIGHGEMEGLGRVQFIDTPGLLDRPLSKRNKIEMQAIVALKHLGGLVLYIMDPTETCGYSLREQVSLLKDIRVNFSNNLIVVINKKDLEMDYKEKFDGIRSIISMEGVPCVEISAEKGEGITSLMNMVRSMLERV